MRFWKRYNIFRILDEIERMMQLYYDARRAGKTHTDAMNDVLDWAFEPTEIKTRQRVVRYVHIDLIFQLESEQLKLMVKLIILIRHRGLKSRSDDDRGINAKLFKTHVSLREKHPEVYMTELSDEDAFGSRDAWLY